MDKKIVIALFILSLIGLVGCTTTTTTTTDRAYFDMPCDSKGRYNTCEKQEICNNICDNSGIRIREYQYENKVMFADGKFICKCY